MTKKLELVNNSDEVVYSKIMIDTSHIDTSVSKYLKKTLPYHSHWPTLVTGKGEDFWENYISCY